MVDQVESDSCCLENSCGREKEDWDEGEGGTIIDIDFCRRYLYAMEKFDSFVQPPPGTEIERCRACAFASYKSWQLLQ